MDEFKPLDVGLHQVLRYNQTTGKLIASYGRGLHSFTFSAQLELSLCLT